MHLYEAEDYIDYIGKTRIRLFWRKTKGGAKTRRVYFWDFLAVVCRPVV